MFCLDDVVKKMRGIFCCDKDRGMFCQLFVG